MESSVNGDEADDENYLNQTNSTNESNSPKVVYQSPIHVTKTPSKQVGRPKGGKKRGRKKKKPEAVNYQPLGKKNSVHAVSRSPNCPCTNQPLQRLPSRRNVGPPTRYNDYKMEHQSVDRVPNIDTVMSSNISNLINPSLFNDQYSEALKYTFPLNAYTDYTNVRLSDTINNKGEEENNPFEMKSYEIQTKVDEDEFIDGDDDYSFEPEQMTKELEPEEFEVALTPEQDLKPDSQDESESEEDFQRPSSPVAPVPVSPIARLSSKSHQPLAPPISIRGTQGKKVPLVRIHSHHWKESFDLQKISKFGKSIITRKNRPPKPICYLCASAGLNYVTQDGVPSMVYCSVCLQSYHSYCVPDTPAQKKKMKMAQWTCQNCVFCDCCGGSTDPGRPQITCGSCWKMVHKDCFGNEAVTSPWKCHSCIRCVKCGTDTAGSTPNSKWKKNNTLCEKCYYFEERGKCCLICETKSNVEKMIQCTSCHSWNHANCENISDEMLSDHFCDPINYRCINCDGRSAILEYELNKRKKLMLDEDHRHLSLLRSRIIHPRNCQWWKDLKTRIALKLRKLISDFQYNPEIARIFREKILKYSVHDSRRINYRSIYKQVNYERIFRASSVSATNLHFKHIIKLIPETKNREIAHKTYHEVAPTYFKWFNFAENKPYTLEEIQKVDSLRQTPSMNLHNYTKTSLSFNKSQITKRLSFIEDISADLRKCILCSGYGDSDPTKEGRLLYTTQDDWIHVNCARWSAEVQETKRGVLFKVDKASSRGRMLRCDYCGNSGATVGCHTVDCSCTYHFMCAREVECRFQFNRKVFCFKHRSQADKQQTMTNDDFAVRKRILVDTSNKRIGKSWQDFISSADVSVLTGTVVVHALGLLTTLAVGRNYLVPKSYSVSRWFWSPVEPGLKVRYRSRTFKQALRLTEQQLHDLDGVNVTIRHDDVIVDKKVCKKKPVKVCPLEKIFVSMVTDVRNPKLLKEGLEAAIRQLFADLQVAMDAEKVPDDAREAIKQQLWSQLQPFYEKADQLEQDCNDADVISSENFQMFLYRFYKKRQNLKDKMEKEEFRKLMHKLNITETAAEQSSIFQHSLPSRFHNNTSYLKFDIECSGFHRCSDDVTEIFKDLNKLTEEAQMLENHPPPKILDPLRFLGLRNEQIYFLFEQFPNLSKCLNYKPKFSKKLGLKRNLNSDAPSFEGCARSRKKPKAKAYDIFNFVKSSHRKDPINSEAKPEKQAFKKSQQGYPSLMQFRTLKKAQSKKTYIKASPIHGIGLYANEDIAANEMICEYNGEVIRKDLADLREKRYQKKGIGCYMFRCKDVVIDATRKGNAARFINHSCSPNCESVIICDAFSTNHHIVIQAARAICRGEELTYDYKFEEEKEEDKIKCLCESYNCRKYLN